MKRIVFRTCGGKRIGYGHYYRCLSLAKALMIVRKDLEIIFLINEELVGLLGNTPFSYIVTKELREDIALIAKGDLSLFIFDSYLGNDEYLRKIKSMTRLMLIDDNNDLYDATIPDILYNGNIHAPSLKYSPELRQLQLLGSKYLIMKEEYWKNSQPEVSQKEGVLITTGGSDEYSIAHKMIRALKSIKAKIKVIIGPGYTEDNIATIEANKTDNIELILRPASLKPLISTSKIVITAGGSTVYEVLSQRSMPVLYSIAENQDLICETLQGMGISYLGKHPNINYDVLKELLPKLASQTIKTGSLPYSIVSGEGTLAVAQVLSSIL